MECQPAGFGCQACWEHLQTDGERRKDTFNKHTNDRSNNTCGRQTKHKQKKRRHRMKKPSSQKWFFFSQSCYWRCWQTRTHVWQSDRQRAKILYILTQ